MQQDVAYVDCPDIKRPKDHLVKQVQTPYFMLLHDDIQILRAGWLEQRLKMLKAKPRIGVQGIISFNQKRLPWWRQFSRHACLSMRFFPLAMLVKKEMQDELDLKWGTDGRQAFFDTGAIAYLQFLRQKKWRFQKYDIYGDIKHWNIKTWAVRKLEVDQIQSEQVTRNLSIREKNMKEVRRILEDEAF